MLRACAVRWRHRQSGQQAENAAGEVGHGAIVITTGPIRAITTGPNFSSFFLEKLRQRLLGVVSFFVACFSEKKLEKLDPL